MRDRLRRPGPSRRAWWASTRSPTNMAMASLDGFERGALLDEARLRIAARERIAQLSVRAPDELAKVGTLSGGNQQKVQVARWLIADTPILVLDDPTRGVDVGARGEIHAILAELAASGRALLLVSSDASELLAVCARIIVMRGGRIASELVAADTSERALIDDRRRQRRADDARGPRAVSRSPAVAAVSTPGAIRRATDANRPAQLHPAARGRRRVRRVPSAHRRAIPLPAQPRAPRLADGDRRAWRRSAP